MSLAGLPDWPVLTRYDQEHLHRIAMPLGGIGTGTVSLGGRGNLRDWEIMNRPAKGFAPARTFFAINAKPEGEISFTRILEGPIDPSDYQGPEDAGVHGSGNLDHGLPRFRSCSFEAAYPFGQVILGDPDSPVDVRIKAFNPLVPGDPDASSIPAAIIRYSVTNTTSTSVQTSVSGNMENFIGYDGYAGQPSNNINEFKKATGKSTLQGIFMRSAGVDPLAEQYGTMALATIAADGVTHRRAWDNLRGGGNLSGTSIIDFWNDFKDDGFLEHRAAGRVDAPHASLAVSQNIPPKETLTYTFLLTWHFPNRSPWSPTMGEYTAWERDLEQDRLRNHYTTRYEDAWSVAERTADLLEPLENKTLAFVNTVTQSDIPDVIKEAALYNLTALRSQTTFQTEDGILYGWEGCYDNSGCCPGSCTHVWNYEQATAHLFGSLACSMRQVEFKYSTRDDGRMSFRTMLPLYRATEWEVAAADGQMGCIIKLYRDWILSGDDEMLRDLWPKARKAMEFCWIPGGWDADRDGVMEGCQHNTLDIEYFGPNPIMAGWYLGALLAAKEMAEYLDEVEFSEYCFSLYNNGSQWVDANLFNGEYYEHHILPTGNSFIADGLRYHNDSKVHNLHNPEMQLGKGCQVDQLVGQFAAHVCGLGHLLDPQKIRKALKSIMKYNFQHGFFDNFNPGSSFVLGDESGMLMVTYPKGEKPDEPLPLNSMVMTGFEYSAASLMIYEGERENAIECIEAIRSRYDGRKRNPFDEAEAGHHYSRAMTSWGALIAYTGFKYSAITQTIGFSSSDKPTKIFWSNGYAWGSCIQTRHEQHTDVELNVLHSCISIKEITLDDVSRLKLNQAVVIEEGASEMFRLPA